MQVRPTRTRPEPSTIRLLGTAGALGSVMRATRKYLRTRGAPLGRLLECGLWVGMTTVAALCVTMQVVPVFSQSLTNFSWGG